MAAPESRARAEELVERGKAAGTQFKRSTWGRTWLRFSSNHGTVLAAGIAYYSLASIAAGAVIATTLATARVAADEELRSGVLDFLADAVPGLLATEDSSGIIDPTTLTTSKVAGAVGVISFIILVNTAARYVWALRTSLRTMLGAQATPLVKGKLRDVITLVALALIAVVGLGIQVAASGAADWIASLVGAGNAPGWVIRVVATAAGVVADALFVAVALLVLGRVRWSRRVAWVTLAAAIAIGAVRAGVSLLVSGSTANPVLAPFAAIITLLVFVDVVNIIVLVSAAWLGVADGPEQPVVADAVVADAAESPERS